MDTKPGRPNYIAPVLRVADFTASLRFYGEQLGFSIEFIYEDFYACITHDGARIHL